MIEWKKYDKSNPPPLFRDYLIYNNEVHIARLDKMGDYNMFHKSGGSGYHLGVIFYAEINLP